MLFLKLDVGFVSARLVSPWLSASKATVELVSTPDVPSVSAPSAILQLQTVIAPGEKSEADRYFSSLSDARIACHPSHFTARRWLSAPSPTSAELRRMGPPNKVCSR